MVGFLRKPISAEKQLRMLVDLAQHRPDFSTTVFDVCVVGGGVAGITLAIKLGRAGRHVLLLEAGDRDASAKSQAYYRGELGELENLPLDVTRIRALGGSSQHWGGWCRAREAYDFARTDLTSDGAWPIGKPDLDPYVREARAMLGITEDNGANGDLAGADQNLQTIRMSFSEPPANLGANFFDELRQSKNVTLLLNSPYLSASFTDAGSVNSVTVFDEHHSSTPLTCKARLFVFAMGAIENVRQLLILNQKNSGRFGRSSLYLGRYYMQHLHQELGEFVILSENAANAFTKAPRVFLASTEKYLRHNGRGAFRLYSTSSTNCSGIVARFRNVVNGTSCHGGTAAGTVSITCEQIPNSDSRILLSGESDEFGQARVKLDWRISGEDHAAMREAAFEYGRYLIRADIGRLNVNPVVLSSAKPLQGSTALFGAAGAAGHQLGGARMSAQPEDGVVDKDCRIWSINNLYVAGSAVFRTSGHATPTFTITQLALRLADTLNQRLT
jgi:hypothetical protein